MAGVGNWKHPQAPAWNHNSKQRRQDYRIHTISHDGKPVKTPRFPYHYTDGSLETPRTIAQLLAVAWSRFLWGE